MFPFIPCPWVGWCFCHITALFLPWYFLTLFVGLPLGLRVEVSAIPISWVTPPFSPFYCPTFLLDRFTQHLRLIQPILFLGHPWPAPFFGHPRPISFFSTFFFLHSHGLLLNHLGSPSPIATFFFFGFIGLQTNSIYQFFSLGSSGMFFAFFLFLMIPMSLLLHSLGLPWPICFL